MKTLILTAQDIAEATDRSGLRKAMARGLKALASNEAANFARQVIEIDAGRVMGFMPAFSLPANLIGYKAASVFSTNRKSGRDAHQGLVVLTDPNSGRTVAILEASSITRLRTAAVSAAASDLLSRPESKNLALIGTGRQAFEHALAISETRTLKSISICGRSRERAEELKRKLSNQITCTIEITADIRAALANADIAVTCTASADPLLHIDQVTAGTHINAIGACRPGQVEIELSSRAELSIFMDSQAACMLEAEELISPLKSGTLNSTQIRGELGEVLSEQIQGRRSREEITLFKSVGLGIEDVMAAGYILERARALGLGQEINFEGLP